MTRDAAVVVLSTGRSGSTLVSRLLSSPGAALSHQARGSRPVNILGNLAAAGWMDPRRAAALSRRLWSLDPDEPTADPLRSMLTAARIRRTPATSLRVVHVVRDPRAFVRSFMSWKRQSLKRSFLHHLVPGWQPTPWMAGECGLGRWIAMSKFEHFCWIWAYKNRLFDSLAESCTYRRFRMEDLVAERGGALEDLYRFAGVGFDGVRTADVARVNPSREQYPAWPSWTAGQAAILERHCGTLMREYGYGNEPEWRALAAAAGS